MGLFFAHHPSQQHGRSLAYKRRDRATRETLHLFLDQPPPGPTFNPRGGYLAFLERISPKKGVERAIKVAQTLGIPLKIAAKVDRVDEVYFRDQIAPLLRGPGAEFVGEIDEQEKSEFLGQALALMLLIDWPEPFGLSMIEAMGCGPVPKYAIWHRWAAMCCNGRAVHTFATYSTRPAINANPVRGAPHSDLVSPSA